MLYAEELDPLRVRIGASPDLTALLQRLRVRADPVLAQPPVIPRLKALLSTDGGLCPADRTPLRFDPWSPETHRCPTCGTGVTGERHDRHWARSQHLWVAERAVHLATVGVLGADDACIARAREIVLGYPELYFDLPNRDNVLGPSHLFFSTYLESMWLLNYLSAAMLLRENGSLDEREADRVSAVIDEASGLIGEFNEGMSNRQTWHAAALTAIAVWFEDEDLARTTIEGRYGLLGHLTDGFGEDGLWYEGENYHLFALRGLMVGLEWARAAGSDLLTDPHLASLLGHALLAPARTALPDLTYPARKDARYGVSLAQPVHLELWEAGRAWVEEARPEIDRWLAALYAVRTPPDESIDSYLHEAGEILPPTRTRADLSWWALCTMAPEAGEVESSWSSEGRFFPTAGLAILRAEDRYVSLECGAQGGGHGHADRLNLTVHASGVHWLPDPGAGSYVSRDLFWYRATLAHNAPLLDTRSQSAADTWCVAYEQGDTYGWARGRWGEVTRTVITGPSWVVDLVELDVSGDNAYSLLTPWHPQGTPEVEDAGQWEAAELGHEFISHVERLTTDPPGHVRVALHHDAGGAVRLFLLPGDGEVLRAEGPGLPGKPARHFFAVRSGMAASARQGAVLDLATESVQTVRSARLDGGVFTLIHNAGEETTVKVSEAGAEVTSSAGTTTLGGGRPTPVRRAPLFAQGRAWETLGSALYVAVPAPVLDGTLANWVLDAPLELTGEQHYRRSEDPYEGAEQIAATAWVNWDLQGFYLAVEVTKPEVVYRRDDATPLRLDNEVDDVHSDGLQVYFRAEGIPERGYLVVPTDEGRIRVHAASGTAGVPEEVRGAWMTVEELGGGPGYRMTIRIDAPELQDLPPGATVEFDLVVNEAQSGRERRAGQLVWSGGEGWVYLRGDRHLPDEWGILELV